MERIWSFPLEILHQNKRLGPKGTSLGIEVDWFDSVVNRGYYFISPMGHFASKEANARARIGTPLNIGFLLLKYRLGIQVVLKSTEEFRAMDPQRRRCYFEDEEKLLTFPVYTKENCELECAWNMAKESCNCVPWFLKRYFPSAKLCDLFGNTCFRH